MSDRRIGTTRPAHNRHVVIDPAGVVLDGPAAARFGTVTEPPVEAAAPPAPAPPLPAPPSPAAPAASGGKRHVVIQGDLQGAPAAPAPPSQAAAPAPPRPAPPRPAPPRPAPARPARTSAPPRRTGLSGPKVPGRRWVKRIAVAAVLLLVTGVVVAFGVGWWAFNQITKVPVASVLSPPSPAGMNTLIVGTDSREGIDESSANADAFLGGGFSDSGPSRTDTMMILRVGADGRQTLLSVPRDLWVRNPTTGENGRINAVYQSGPAALVQAVQQLGIPVHHYVEINFVTFADVVDAIGGIDIDFPAPARDKNSGLDIPTAGTHHLGGVDALAYVRSRYYEELRDGAWVADPTADLGRVTRQRAFVGALVHELTGTRNPVTLLGVARTMGSSAGLKIDDAMSYPEALGLAWRLRSFAPESETLPVVGVTRGGASTLDLGPGADAIIAGFQ